MIRMIFTLALLGATPAFAQFQGSDDRLFIDWPDLDEEYQAGAEFLIHAIVPQGRADQTIYVISRDRNGDLTPFGAFDCGGEFTPLKSFTNGFRDIRCVSVDGVGNGTTYILRVPNNNGYELTLP